MPRDLHRLCKRLRRRLPRVEEATRLQRRQRLLGLYRPMNGLRPCRGRVPRAAAARRGQRRRVVRGRGRAVARRRGAARVRVSVARRAAGGRGERAARRLRARVRAGRVLRAARRLRVRRRRRGRVGRRDRERGARVVLRDAVNGVRPSDLRLLLGLRLPPLCGDEGHSEAPQPFKRVVPLLHPWVVRIVLAVRLYTASREGRTTRRSEIVT